MLAAARSGSFVFELSVPRQSHGLIALVSRCHIDAKSKWQPVRFTVLLVLARVIVAGHETRTDSTVQLSVRNSMVEHPAGITANGMSTELATCRRVIIPN